jgi:hypothetical protein
MSPKEFIENLQKENSTFGGPRQAATIANLLETVSGDIYSEQRFVFELIQNADDSADGLTNEVNFDFNPTALIVSHNGKKFSPDDIISITDAGASTKKADPTKTGYKGIGFKSVFDKSKRVSIISGEYRFRFDKNFHGKKFPWQIVPIWTELEDLPTEVHMAISRMKYNVSTIIELGNAMSLQKDLDAVLANGQILLFLRKVCKISISLNGVHKYSIEKKVTSASGFFKEIELKKNTAPISSWLVKTFDEIPVPESTRQELQADESTPEKLRDIEMCDLSFAVRIEGENIRALSESVIFTYLPTKVKEFEFPFLVNASFLTNASREAIHIGKIWNQWLFSLIAEKLLDLLTLLGSSKYKYQILRILPTPYRDSHPLKAAFDVKFLELASNKRFILSTKEKLKVASEILLDRTGLSAQAFIHQEAILDFLRKEKGYELGEDCFVNPNLEEPSKLKDIGVRVFELENLHTFFSSESFTKTHTVAENIHLIKYLKEKSDKDKDGEWFETVQKLPFIFDEKSILRNPTNGVCFPIGVSTTELGGLAIIHSEVYAQIDNEEQLKTWLKKLGVKEPSELAAVTNIILPGIKDGNFITVDNYLQITRYLFRLYHEKQLDDEMLERLRELPLKIKSKAIEFKPAEQCFMPNKYRPKLSIEGLISEIPILSEEYLTAGTNEYQWADFFKAVKVKDSIEVRTIDDNTTLPVLRASTLPEWVYECQATAERVPGSFGFDDDNVIVGIKEPTFLKQISRNYPYSKLFWRHMLPDIAALDQLSARATFRYGKGFGRNKFSCSVDNYFTWFTKTQACIPTSVDKLMKAEEVFINDKDIKEIAGKYLPVFDVDEPISSEWKSFLKLRGRLELEDLLEILALTHQKALDEENTIKPSTKRIGQVYGKLAALLSDLDTEGKQKIKDWAKENKLYTNIETFEFPHELNWITIDGFSMENVEMKVIKVPENSYKDAESFKQLMELMGVQIIDKFIPTFTDQKSELSLKNKLEEVLPYVASIVAKKRVEDVEQEYNKLFEVLNKTTFLSAKEINLSFENNGELVKGPSLVTYVGDDKFYFRGKWSSERTLLDLLHQLAILLKIEVLTGELRFLLMEQDTDEIDLWLREENIDIAKIPAKRVFSKPLLTQQTIIDIDINTGSAPKIETKEEAPKSRDYPKFKPSVDVAKVSLPEFQFASQESTEASKEPTEVDTEEVPVYQDMEDEESRLVAGNWSEHLVYRILKESGKYTSVHWENEVKEQGKPYDIKAVKDGRELFFEVKGTPSADKYLVQFSPQELNFMYEKKADYIFIRVYKAGSSDATAVNFENPHEKIYSKAIGIFLKVPPS